MFDKWHGMRQGWVADDAGVAVGVVMFPPVGSSRGGLGLELEATAPRF
jgi:hypothetical protein